MTKMFGATLLATLLCASAAQAIIIRHDVDDSNYVVSDTDYPAVADLIGPGDCLGTLIHPSYLLTVAHCAVDLSAGATLIVGGNGHAVAEVISHPSFDDENFDIALVRFEQPVSGVTPVPLYRGSGEVGATITLVGRGTTATGLEGEDGGDTDGLLRRATNVVTDANQHYIEIVFEPGTDGDTTALEGVGAAGDSGGPSFIEAGGITYLAGLNSFGDVDGNGGIGTYGAFDYQTRVSRYLDWIESFVDFTELPEPGAEEPDPVDEPVDEPIDEPAPGDDVASDDEGLDDDPSTSPDDSGADEGGEPREGRVDDAPEQDDAPSAPDGDVDGAAPASGSGDSDDNTSADLSDPTNPADDEGPRPAVTITFGCDAAPGGADGTLVAFVALLFVRRSRRGR